MGRELSVRRRNRVRYVIVLLAVLGIVVSSLALKVHYDDPGKEPCSINDKWDCGTVNHSEYAMIHGIPVAAIGMAGYLLIGFWPFVARRRFFSSRRDCLRFVCCSSYGY